MKNKLIYVYCLSDSSPELSRYAEFEGLKCDCIGGFFVIYKNVSEKDFSEENLKKNISDIAWLESNAREHIGVISRIMEHNTVIPFQFGTIYKSVEGLANFIEKYSSSLAENINKVGGHEEWSVKIYCDRNVFKHQIEGLSKEVSALEIEIRRSSPGKAYLLERKKSELIETEIDRFTYIYSQNYYNLFLKHSELTQINNLLPKDQTGRKDDFILNAAFLVKKNSVFNFIQTAELLRKEHKLLGFDVIATGPWPPFSFISIKA